MEQSEEEIAAEKLKELEIQELDLNIREKDKHQESAFSRPRTLGTFREVNELNDRTTDY